MSNSFDSRAFSLCFGLVIIYHVALGACCRRKGQKMKKFRMKPKVLLAMTLGLLLAFNLSAQEQHGRPGGLFGEIVPTESNGLMNRSESPVGGYFTGQGFGATNGNITGQTFGVPLGSGLLFLITAGIGYSALKSKKTKQNQNRKEK